MGNRTAIREIDAGASGLRASLLEAALRWHTVDVKRDDELGRDIRLNIRAHAEVYGIPLIDQNDKGPNGPLTAKELARLPELRRHVREGHLADIVLFRVTQSARGFIRNWGLILIQVAVLFVLLGVAFGFASPVRFFHYLYGWGLVALHWVQQHPQEMWWAARVFAGGTFALLLFGLLVGFDAFDEEPARPPAPKPAPVPIRRYEIQNFRERSAFGDASLAEKEQVARALKGNQGSFAPNFED